MSKNDIDLNNKIIQLYKKGYSSKDICSYYNVSALMVRNCLRSAGFNTCSYRKISQTNKDKIILLVKAGYSYRQIESLLQISFHFIREVIEAVGLIGYAPRNYQPIQLEIKEEEISIVQINKLQELYCSGKYGLAKCSAQIQVTDKEFLWFVFHLTEEDKVKHNKRLSANIKKMYTNNIPITAIAKKMEISPSIIKKIIV